MVRKSSRGTIRVGISGWTYAPWRGVFYPKGLPQSRELAYAAERFSTIEINGTFYCLQRPSSFASWASVTPPNFVFSVKGSRFITHMLKLRNAEQALANFFASGLLALGPKLGPILWQFPPNFSFNPAVLEAFLQLLPRTNADAAILGRRHDHRVEGRAWLETDQNRPLRHAIEIRNNSFLSDDFIHLLRRYRVALVCADTVDWPRLVDVTSDFGIAASMAQKSSTPAAMGAMPLPLGPIASSPGPLEAHQPESACCPSVTSKQSPTMCTSTSTTMRRSARR